MRSVVQITLSKKVELSDLDKLLSAGISISKNGRVVTALAEDIESLNASIEFFHPVARELKSKLRSGLYTMI